MICHGFLGCIYFFFSAIPAPLVAALCAAAGTLAGVALTSRDARKRLKIQLSHDADEKVRERQHASEGKRDERQSQIRREVFMEAFDGVTMSIQSLARMCDLNSPLASTTEALAMAGSKIARVRAVGAHETVLALTKLTSAIAVANVTLVSKRAPLDGKIKYLADLDATAKRESAESDRWFEIQSQMLLQGPLPQSRFDYIANRIELHRKEATRVGAHKADVEKVIGIETLALIRVLLEQQRTVSLCAVEANAAMRRELGFAGEHEDEVRAAFVNQDDAGRKALEEFLSSIEAVAQPAKEPVQ